MTDQPWSTQPWNASEPTPEPIHEPVQGTEQETQHESTQESVQEYVEESAVQVDVPAEAPAPPQPATTDNVAPAAPWYASAIAASVAEPENDGISEEEHPDSEADDREDSSATGTVKDKGTKKKGKAKRSQDEKSPGKAAKAKQDKRVTLKVKVPKSLRTSLVREAKQRDVSVGELLAAYLPDRMNP